MSKKSEAKVETEIVSKLTTATLGWKKSQIQAALNEHTGTGPLSLYKLMGIVRKAEGDEGANGQFVRFIGDFAAEGVDPEGAPFDVRSSKCYIPGSFETDLESKVLANTDDKGKVKPVRFAVEIGVKKDDKSAVGYTYVIKPLIKLEESDELTQLMSEVG